MPRRVRRPKDKETLLIRLTDRDQGGPFQTFKDALVFAAAVGYAHNRREPFEHSSEPIDWGVFSGFGDEALVNMIPIAQTSQLELLDPERFDERLTWFEEYANGGLAIIEQRLAASTQEPLDAILELVQSFRRAASTMEEPDWDMLASQLL